ncbi:hypothetical protein [Flavobacterium frigidarium]|uniref:hypothetical protein n=1 Tax=Flavobacterium frigidarium TaxID=99286 RepID=UPI000422C4F8|nr:hypothetical protein [Flavobacterium frigidarium]
MGKSTQPKLADSLSVFIDQIEKIEKNNIILLRVNEQLNQKIEQLYNYEPKLDFRPLEAINNRQIELLEDLNFNIGKVLKEHTLILEKEKLQTNSMFNRLRALVIFLFFMTIIACLIAISFYNRKVKNSTNQSPVEISSEAELKIKN